MSHVFYVCEIIKGFAVVVACFIAKRKKNAK